MDIRTSSLGKWFLCAVAAIVLYGQFNANLEARTGLPPATGTVEKPRVIVTQDGEVDDRSSMVRFLLYTSDFDVAGIIAVNSQYQRRGHGRAWIDRQLDLYAEVLPNLRKHHPDFPDAERLRSVIRIGNQNPDDLHKPPAEMATKDTMGSQLIIDTLLDDDPRIVHVLAWGGNNTVAYAMWKLKTQYPRERFEYAASRIRIYAIMYTTGRHSQDGGGPWIIENMPGVRIYQASAWSRTWNYSSVGRGSYSPPEIQQYMSKEWLHKNVKSSHGPLGEIYPQSYVSEGDTPSFLPLINNGLDQHLDYTLGGWGGRPVCKSGNHMVDGVDDSNDRRGAHKTFWRWIPAAQNDFAARMDWCVKEFKEANHPPVAKVKGDLDRSVKAGETVRLSATATDPDGNELTCKWWQYTDADSATATVTIANSDSLGGASFVVPNEPGKQVHIILEVTDSGAPPLTHYQRTIYSIR